MTKTNKGTRLILLLSAITSLNLLAISPNKYEHNSVIAVDTTTTTNANTTSVKLIESFTNGIAIARQDAKYGIVSQNGNWIVEPKFEWDESQSNGFWITINNKNEKQISVLKK